MKPAESEWGIRQEFSAASPCDRIIEFAPCTELAAPDDAATRTQFEPVSGVRVLPARDRARESGIEASMRGGAMESRPGGGLIDRRPTASRSRSGKSQAIH